MGFLLIERGCLLDAAAQSDPPTYLAPDGTTLLTAVSRELCDGRAGWSHDHAFCERWSAAGGEVWAYAAADIRHVDGFRFGVPFPAYLNASRAKGERRAVEETARAALQPPGR